MSVTAWATVGLAIVGALSIAANVFTIRAAADEASASRDLIAETRRDRELAHRPFLTFESPVGNPFSRPRRWNKQDQLLLDLVGALPEQSESIGVRVRNIGRGIALEVQYFAWMSYWEDGMDVCLASVYISSRSALSSDQYEPVTFTAHPTGSATPPACLAEAAAAQPNEPAEALICMDQFGKRYIFARDASLPKIWPDDYIDHDDPRWINDVGTVAPPVIRSLSSDLFFTYALGQSPTGRSYIGLVVQSAPVGSDLLSSNVRAGFRDFARKMRPGAIAVASTRDSVEYRDHVGGSEDAPTWLASCKPGFLVSLVQAAPRNNERGFFFLEAIQWWHRGLDGLRGLMTDLNVERANIGLFLNDFSADGAHRGFSFGDAPTPHRDAGSGVALNWSERIPVPVPMGRIRPALLLYAIPDLLESYGYTDYDPLLDWLNTNMLGNLSAGTSNFTA